MLESRECRAGNLVLAKLATMPECRLVSDLLLLLLLALAQSRAAVAPFILRAIPQESEHFALRSLVEVVNLSSYSFSA